MTVKKLQPKRPPKHTYSKLPKELASQKNPVCPRRAVVIDKGKLAQDIIRYGLSNEVSISKIEKNNTITFVCDLSATKPQIKDAIEKLYNARPKKVNTAISFKGIKKAYAIFPKEVSAVDIASQANII